MKHRATYSQPAYPSFRATAPSAWVQTAASLVLLGCVACTSPSPREYVGETPPSQIGPRDSSYALASSADDLGRLLAEDLEVANTAAVFSGLEAFVGENVMRKTTTRANLIWEQVDPAARLQFGRARDAMTAVKELGNVLKLASVTEMETAFESLRNGDFDQVQRLRDEPMGVFHPTTAAMSFEVRPYAMLAHGVLSYRDLATQDNPSSADVQAALDKLAAAQSELAKIGETEGMFLADAAAAQSLERAGQIDAAAEYWMRIADSHEFTRQPAAMRNLVAARIQTYSVRMKERLILEVEDERRAEIRALDAEYDVKVSGLRQKHAAFDAWAREGFRDASTRMAELAQADATQQSQLEAIAMEAKARDARLEQATDALAVRLANVREGTAAVDRRVTGVTAELRQELAGAVAVVRSEQAELAGRTGALESQAAGLDSRTAGLEERTDEIAANDEEAMKKLRALGYVTDELVSKAEQDEAMAKALVAEVEASDAELATALHDLAAYRVAVEGLTTRPNPVAAPKSDETTTVAAYLSMHAVPDVFGVEGGADDVAAFYVPAESGGSE